MNNDNQIKNLQRIIDAAYDAGAVRVMELLGISSGEISQTKARAVYGKWFVDACKDGRIQPCRIESGHRGTRYYRVTDILKLKTQDAASAQLVFSTPN